MLTKLKNMAGKIARPVWSAAKLILGTVLPGSPAVIDLIEETVEWANGKITPPAATRDDLHRVEGVIRCLEGDSEGRREDDPSAGA